MNKPPAFQFYADDFLAGTFAMSLEERGLYITLLCRQWTQGHVTGEEITRLSCAMAQPLVSHVVAKFKESPKGCFKNARMEEVREAQQEYRENRAKSGKLGAERRWHSYGTAMAQPMANDSSPSPTPSPNKKEVAPLPARKFLKPSVQDVQSQCRLIGLVESEASKFWNYYESIGWVVGRKPMKSWTHALVGWKERSGQFQVNGHSQQPNDRWDKPAKASDSK